MFERFTDRARRILVVAQEQARELDHNYLGTEHLLLALAWTEDTIPYTAITTFTTHDLIKEAVEKALATVPAPGAIGAPPFTPRAKKVLELSLREALQLGHNYIGPEHMLLAVIREGGGLATTVLDSLGVNANDLRSATIALIGTKSPGSPQAGMDATLTFSHGEKVEILNWLERFGATLDNRRLPYPMDRFYTKLRGA